MITAFCIQKGGTGKTTISTNVAARLAKMGDRVLLGDLDPQHNSSLLFFPDYLKYFEHIDENGKLVGVSKMDGTNYAAIIERKPLPIYASKIPNLDIAPSSELLSGTDMLLAAAPNPEFRLKQQLDLVKDQYDHIIIDCPPSLDLLTINALVAADEYVIVMEPGAFSLDGVNQLEQIIQVIIRGKLKHDIVLKGCLFNNKAPTQVSVFTRGELQRYFGDKLFRTSIPRNTELEKSQLKGLSVFDTAPDSDGAKAIDSLIFEMYRK